MFSLGPDHILWNYIKSILLDDTYLEHMTNITNACIYIEHWPSYFKKSILVIIPKLNKASYDTPKAFQPIVLLNTTGKLIKKVINNCLQFHTTTNSYLYPNQLGDVQQKSTIDTGIYLTHLVRAGWVKQCYTSVIAFDVTQFFLSLNHVFLLSCLKKAGLNCLS